MDHPVCCDDDLSTLKRKKCFKTQSKKYIYLPDGIQTNYEHYFRYTSDLSKYLYKFSINKRICSTCPSSEVESIMYWSETMYPKALVWILQTVVRFKQCRAVLVEKFFTNAWNISSHVGIRQQAVWRFLTCHRLTSVYLEPSRSSVHKYSENYVSDCANHDCIWML